MRRRYLLAALLLFGCGSSEHENRLGVGIQRVPGTAVVTCRAQYCSVQLLHCGPTCISILVVGENDARDHSDEQVDVSGLRNIRVDLGDGINGLWAFQLAFAGLDNLTIESGDGDDDVRLDGAAVSQRLRVTTGRGADYVSVFASEGAIATDVDTGAGPDALDVTSGGVGPVRLATGDGDDIVTLERNASASPLRLDTGSGDDAASVTLWSFAEAPRQTLRFVGGPGSDRLDLTGTPTDDQVDVQEFEHVSAGTERATP